MSAVQYNRPRAIQQQRYADNPYSDVLGLIGTIMGQNANQRNQAGIASTLAGLGTDQPDNQGSLLSGVMPDTNFAPQYAPQPDQQQANFGIGQMPQSAQQRMGGLLGSTAFSTQPQTTQQPANDQQVQFDAAVQANPEWYRKGVNPTSEVYVGDRPDLANNATVTESGKAVDLTPTPVTAKATNSYMSAPVKTDIAKQYKQMGASAIQELVSKRGMSAQDAIRTVGDAINKRTEEDYTAKANAYSDQLHGQLDDITNMDFSTNANKSKAMGKIMQLNYGLQKIGRPGVDVAALKDLMAVNDLKIDKVDTGDGVQYYGHSSDGSRVVPIGEKIMTQVSPGQQLSADIAREGHQVQREGHQASIAAAGARASAKAAGGLSDANKASMFKWASGFTLQPTGETDVMGKPVMTRVQNNPQLATQLAGELGYGGGQQGGDQQGATQTSATGNPRLDGMIANMRNGGASEQTINDMIWEEQNKTQGQQRQPGQTWDEASQFNGM